MKIFRNKRTRVFIIIMGTLVLIAVAVSCFWFRYENQSADPRVVDANILYAGYNDLAAEGNYPEVLTLLDSIESIYVKFPHYNDSYEVGVLYNNRAAVYVSMAISGQDNDSLVKDSLLSVAEKFALTSIEIYNRWLEKWGDLDEYKTTALLKLHFKSSDPFFKGKNIDRYIKKRKKEINEARFETPRRLSASHTNLGIIYRHKLMYDKAVEEYLKALELWDDNLAAENNLNILMNKPLKKRSTFRKIFPKDRREK